MSIREQILAHVETLLAASPPAVLAFGPVRSRAIALHTVNLPAEAYYPQSDAVRAIHKQTEGALPGTRGPEAVRRELTIAVECIAKAGLGTTADAELEAMTTHVTTALAGAGAGWKSVGAIGAAEMQTEFTMEVWDAPVALATVIFRIDYLSQAGNPGVL